MAIEVRGIKKKFKEVTALENVTLTLENNKIYGLLGRNGAGKTTLLNLITNRQFPDEGSVMIDGLPAMENDKAQGKIYCMSERNYYPEGTKIQQLFRWTKDFYPSFQADYAKALADKFGLHTKGRFKDLSTGYASICKLILGLAAGTDYLLLDEPVLGLDANHRELFYRELIANYSDRPRTIVLSTHLIEEVAKVIEQVVIIKQGKILMDKPTEEVVQMGYTVSGKAAEVDCYCEGKNVLGVDTLGGLKTACIYGKRDTVPSTLETGSLDLQKLFIQLTNA